MQTVRRTLLFTFAFIFLTAPVVSNAQSPLQFVPVTPCRLVDTRPQNGGSGPIQGGTFQNFTIAGMDSCGDTIPGSPVAYSLNVTVVPSGELGYLTIWPTGQQQPGVSNTNSVDGRVKATAAIVGAGTGGAVSVFASNTTNVILDINGYFAPIGASTLAFYPLTPCRVVDTRNNPGPLGGPFLMGGVERDFPVLTSSCNLPSSAQAFSFNYTVVPHEPLGYLKTWATGQPQPNTSTLNSVTGTVVANAALVPPGMLEGNPGYVAVFPSNDTDLVIDVNGYFAPATSAPAGLSLFTLAPCRVLDTRLTTGAFSGTQVVNVIGSSCASNDSLPSLAQTLVTNATVVPQVPLGYLTLWPNGEPRPGASTLNAIDGAVTSNLAVVPTTNGFINAFASNSTQLVVDLFDYFAIPSGLNGNYTFSINGYVGPSSKQAGRAGLPQPPGPCPNEGPFMMAGSFIADGNGHVSGVLDLNCAGLNPDITQPLDVGFKGTYSIQPNGLGTMTITPTLNLSFGLSVAISSTGDGRLILNNESNSYVQNSWGTGAINLQNPAALSLPQIAGSFASGFEGVDPSLNRYAGAGVYLINQSGSLSGTSDTNDSATGTQTGVQTSGTLSSPDSTYGRGTAQLVVGITSTHWVYYVTSANELTFLAADPITSPANLVLQTMLSQATLPFDNTYLNGVSVVRTSGLSLSDKQKRQLQGEGTTDVVLGLFTADGNGNGSVSLDENNGGTLTQQQVSQGTYSVAGNGRVTLTGFGNGTPPIFYLVAKNEAFVLGQDNSVASGFLVPQANVTFTNASATGTYWGGNYMPVTANVTDSVTEAFADGMGNLNGTIITSDSSGVGSNNFTNTYSIDSTGRMTLYDNMNNLVDIMYVISPTRVAFLPFGSTDTNPSVSVFGSTN